MVDASAARGNLTSLRKALSFTAEGLRRTTTRQAWCDAGWQWLALVGVLFLLDLLFALPVPLRWAGLVLQSVLLLFGIYRALTRRGPRGLGEEWAARMVEEKHPETDNALINAIQFERALPTVNPDQAALMRREMQRAESVAGSLGESGVVDRTGERRSHRRLVGAVSAWLLVVVLFPGGFLAVIPRLFAPWMDDVTPPWSLTHYEVRPPGATVRYGENLNIAATVSGPLPENVMMMTRTGSSAWRQIALENTETRRFAATLVDLREDTWFFVQGAGSRSARYRIHVVRPPTMQSLRATYTFPAYTKKAPATETVGDAGIHGLIHTQALLVIESNRPLQGGEMTVRTVTGESQSAQIRPDPKNPTHGLVEIKLIKSGTYHISLTADDGQVNPDAATGKITVDKDERPSVWFENPGQDLLVTPDMKVPLIVDAEDDNGIQRLEFHRVINELGDSPDRRDLQVQPKVEESMLVDLPDLGVREGDTITYYATALDNAPGRPNIGETEPFTLKVVTRQAYEEALKQQRETEDLKRETRDIINAVKDLAERQEQLAQKMEQLNKQLAKNPNDAGLKEKLAAARKEQGDLQQEAKKLSEALKAYSESPAATELERAIKRKMGEMAQALGKAASGPMQSAQSGNPSSASAAARAAAKSLSQVDRQMQKQVEKTLEHLEKVLPLFMDIERFKALVDEQGQLVLKARQYQQKAELNTSERAKMEQLATRQNQIQQELKSIQEDLRQHAAAALPDFPKAAASARKIADEIGRRQIAEIMQEGQDRFRQWDGPRGFLSAQAALTQMQAMIQECKDCQGGACKGELDVALLKSLGQSGLGNSLEGLCQGMGLGMQPGENGSGFGRGGTQRGSGGQRGGGYSMRTAKAFVPSFRMAGGGGGGSRNRHQNKVGGVPVGISPSDVEVTKNQTVKPPRAADTEAGRFPVEYRKLISKYFQSVAETK